MEYNNTGNIYIMKPFLFAKYFSINGAFFIVVCVFAMWKWIYIHL